MTSTRRFSLRNVHQQRHVRQQEQEILKQSLQKYADEHRVWSHHYRAEEAKLAAQAERALEPKTTAVDDDAADAAAPMTDHHQPDPSSQAQPQAAQLEQARARLAAIHAQNAELADLKRKLQTAHMCRERAVLQEHKQHLRQVESAQQLQLEVELLHADAEAARREAHERQLRQRVAALRTKQDLEVQLVERQHAQHQAKLVAEAERQQVAQTVAEAQAAERAAFEARMRRRLETQRTVSEFLQQQRDLQAMAAQAEAAEEARIAAYAEQKRQAEEARAAQHAAVRQEQDRVFEELCRQKAEAARQAEEEQALLDLLWQEEQAARAAQQEQEQAERRKKMQQELRAANEETLRIRAQRMAAQKEEEQRYRKEAMLRFEQDARMAALGARARNARKLSYKQELDTMLAERQALFEQQLEAQLAQQTAARMAQATAQADVEAQRVAMLREAAMLHKYLPKGTIKSEEEWRLLQEAFAEQLNLDGDLPGQQGDAHAEHATS